MQDYTSVPAIKGELILLLKTEVACLEAGNMGF